MNFGKIQKEFKIRTTRLSPLELASCGGYPKDINIYQSYKTVHNMIPALKEGGVGIVLTESREGIGSELFQKICSGFTCNEDREKELRSNFDIACFMGYTQLHWAQDHRLLAVTNLPAGQIRELNMIPVNTLEEALAMAYTWLPKNFRAYIMPKAPPPSPCPHKKWDKGTGTSSNLWNHYNVALTPVCGQITCPLVQSLESIQFCFNASLWTESLSLARKEACRQYHVCRLLFKVLLSSSHGRE